MISDMDNGDLDFFKKEMGDVKPVKYDKVDQHTRQEALSDAQLACRAAALGLENGKDINYLTLGQVQKVDPLDWLRFKKDGVQEGVYRKLRLGHYDIQASLDLHRKTIKEAHEEVFYFIYKSLKLDLRTLLISQGKGMNSDPPAQMKSYVKHWLGQVPEIIAYHSAIPRHGGAGSVYVLLRKSDKERAENRHRYTKKKPDV